MNIVYDEALKNYMTKKNIPAIVVIKPNMKKAPVAYRIGGKTKDEIRALIDALIADDKK